MNLRSGMWLYVEAVSEEHLLREVGWALMGV